MKAFLKNYRQSPRKVRLVANLIKGKSVEEAEVILSTLAKRASAAVRKLVQSAAANAKQNSNSGGGKLYVKEIKVDEGVTLKRWRPAWRGTTHPLRKRSSHVTLILDKRT